eukprot:6204907-Pleurochrysis_carterae.AAC.1
MHKAGIGGWQGSIVPWIERSTCWVEWSVWIMTICTYRAIAHVRLTRPDIHGRMRRQVAHTRRLNPH